MIIFHNRDTHNLKFLIFVCTLFNFSLVKRFLLKTFKEGHFKIIALINKIGKSPIVQYAFRIAIHSKIGGTDGEDGETIRKKILQIIFKFYIYGNSLILSKILSL